MRLLVTLAILSVCAILTGCSVTVVHGSGYGTRHYQRPYDQRQYGQQGRRGQSRQGYNPHPA